MLIIKKPALISQDDRGVTAEFSLLRKQDDFLLITRKAGTLSGNTYHEGKTIATNPKIFILFTGKIRFSYRKAGEASQQSVEVTAPAILEVEPYTVHKVEALEDIVMLECNAIKDIQEDRIKELV